MSKSEFARRQLKKHGWKEGSGLGKDEHGRADPIKVSLKMDKTGVGHDPGKEFTDHWWLRVFNEAAQKIGIKGKKDKSKVSMSEEEKEQSIKEQRRKNFYKGFVQSATLTNGVEEKTISSDSSDEDEKDTNNAVSVPTLEDIYKFCGGATGHKAARHGIRMEGKIKRASHNEKQFEEKAAERKVMNDAAGEDSLQNSNLDSQNNNLDSERKKRKKKKKDKKAKDEGTVCSDLKEDKKARKRKVSNSSIEGDMKDQEPETIPTKKSKKKKRNKIEIDSNISEIGIPNTSETIDDSLNGVSTNSDNVGSKMKAKDSSTKGDLEDINENETNSCKKKKKKKKKNRE